MYACGWPPDAPTVSTRITDPLSSLLVVTCFHLCHWTLQISNLTLIQHISSLSLLWYVWMRTQTARTGSCGLSSDFSISPWISPLVHSLNKSFPCYYLSLSFCIATVPPAFLPYGDVMETKYCKTVNSALTPVPRSYQHQPLSKRSKKNNLSMDLFVHVNSLIFLYCAMKSWPCPSFLCSRIHSCCTVSELSQLWVFF